MRLSQRQWLRCMNEDNFFTQEQQVGGPNEAPGTSVLGSQLGSLGTARVQGGWSINQRNSYPRRTHITGYKENNAGKMYKKVHSIIFGSIATTTLLTLPQEINAMEKKEGIANHPTYRAVLLCADRQPRKLT